MTSLRGEALAQVPAMALGFDHCIVDTQSDDRIGCAALSKVSDRVLVPCGASPLDVWPLLESLELFRSSRAHVQALVNGHDPRSTLGKRLCGDLHTHGVDVVGPAVARRAIHPEAMAHGEATVSYDRKSHGAREIVQLFDVLQVRTAVVESLARVLH